MSKLEVDKIDPQSGTDLELGTSGDTITIPAGVTFDSSAATNTLPATVVTTTGTQTLTNKSIATTQLTGTITPSDSTVTLAKLTATGTQDATTFLRGDNTFAAAGSPSIDDNGNATAITIDSSENVSIGTTVAVSTLNVLADSGSEAIGVMGRSADDRSRVNLNSNDGATTYAQLEYSATTVELKAVANIPLVFRTNNTERMRINNAGKIFTNQTAQFDDCVTIGGSPFTGDFQIEVSGLLAVNGGSWKQIGMRLSYAGIQDDAGGAQTKDVLITIRGLSTYSTVTGVDTGGGTVGITLNSSTTTASTFTITSPTSTCVGAYVATLFANDNSTMECNA